MRPRCRGGGRTSADRPLQTHTPLLCEALDLRFGAFAPSVVPLRLAPLAAELTSAGTFCPCAGLDPFRRNPKPSEAVVGDMVVCRQIVLRDPAAVELFSVFGHEVSIEHSAPPRPRCIRVCIPQNAEAQWKPGFAPLAWRRGGFSYGLLSIGEHPIFLAPVTGRLSTSVLEIGHERIRGEFGPCILSDFAEPQADARTIVELNYPHIIGI